MSSSRSPGTTLAGVLGFCALAAPAAAAGVVNHFIDDWCMPFVLPADSTALGVKFKNISSAVADFRVSMPVSFFDWDGNPLSSAESAGTLAIRILSDPATRFTYDAITGAPAAGEKDIVIALPPVNQDTAGFGGSLTYGTAVFDITGLGIGPGQTAFAAVTFIPSNASAAIFFLNTGMDPGNTGYLLPHVETAWLASPSYTGDLLFSNDFGPNRFVAMSYEPIALMPKWSGAVDGDWSKAGNWTAGVVVAGGTALFDGTAAARIVDVGAAGQSAGRLRFASNESYTIQGAGGLKIDNAQAAGAGIVLEAGSSGSHTISAAVQIVEDASITIEGGSLNLAGGVSIGPGRTLSVVKAPAGSLQISAITGGAGTLSLAAGTVTKVNGDSSINRLLMPGATLDLTAADLSIASADLATIDALVASGRHGGAWDGAGINSSSLAGDADRAYQTLAVLADGTGVKVMHTRAGDLTGDGLISGADYHKLDQSFLAGGTGTLYSQGNVNYTGGVDGDDYFTMDQSYLNQDVTLSIAGAAARAVPEPSTLGLLAAGALGLVFRRRRNSFGVGR